MKLIIKKLTILTVATFVSTIGLLMLSSCGDKITYVNAPTTTVPVQDTAIITTTTSTTTTMYVSKYDMYVDRVRSSVPPSSSYVSDENLIKYADIVCTVFRNGGNADTIIFSIMETIKTDRDRSFFSQTAGIAVAIICPEYSDRITQA